MKRRGMVRRAVLSAFCAALAAQSAAAQIAAQPLGGLDLFQAGARRADVPEDVWRGASPALAAEVFDRLDDKPLSPAARATALALLGAGAAAPDGASGDTALAAARVRALLALGDAQGADAILDRTPGVTDSPALAEVAAETALHLGQEEDACRIASQLRQERDAPSWLRLRAYCDAVGGRGAAAQLALNLLEQQGVRNPAFSRLMGALLAGEGANAGPASLETGLNAALSRRLGLDLAPALERAAPAALQAIALNEQAPPELRAAAAERARALGLITAEQANAAAPVDAGPPPTPAGELGALLTEAARAVSAEGEIDPSLMERLAPLTASGDKAARLRAQGAALLLAAAGSPVPPELRPAFIRWDAGAADAAGARRLGLDLAADAGRGGEAALITLDIASGAGATGPKLSDRIEIVRALREAGLPLWRLWAREGLEQLAGPAAAK